MKKVIISALVGTLIFFTYQSLMWMGGLHRNFYTYTAKQDTILNTLSANLPAEGMYMMPMSDPTSPHFRDQQEKLETKMPGKPWAMVFFHPAMSDFSFVYMLKGLLLVFISALMVSLVIFYGKFKGVLRRYLVSMSFSVFTLAIAVISTMNWWSFPWSFVKPQVTDLVLGWTLCSIWFAMYLKFKSNPVQG